jgi:hypothetical protein
MKGKLYFGAERQAKLDDALALIKEVFPGVPAEPKKGDGQGGKKALAEYYKEMLARRKFIEQQVAPALLGKPSKWSRPHGFRLSSDGVLIGSGGFGIYWGIDPDVPDYIDLPNADGSFKRVPTPLEERIITLVQVRRETHDPRSKTSDGVDRSGEHKVGAPGGHLHDREQTFQGIMRETMEELCDENRNPVFIPDPDRYSFLMGGRDFISRKDKAMQYAGYAYQLSSDEIRSLKNYTHRLDHEPGFQEAVVEASGNETHGLKLMPLIEVIGLAQQIDKTTGEPLRERLFEKDDFRHTRQFAYYLEVADRLGIALRKKVPSSPLGFTIGDLHKDFRTGLETETRSGGGRKGR